MYNYDELYQFHHITINKKNKKLIKQRYFKVLTVLTAIAIAISASVTVSIGDETNGLLSQILLVSCDVNSTSSDVKSIKPGKSKKSLRKKIN